VVAGPRRPGGLHPPNDDVGAVFDAQRVLLRIGDGHPLDGEVVPDHVDAVALRDLPGEVQDGHVDALTLEGDRVVSDGDRVGEAEGPRAEHDPGPGLEIVDRVQEIVLLPDHKLEALADPRARGVGERVGHGAGVGGFGVQAHAPVGAEVRGPAVDAAVGVAGIVGARVSTGVGRHARVDGRVGGVFIAAGREDQGEAKGQEPEGAHRGWIMPPPTDRAVATNPSCCAALPENHR
jgi:hypothetical protein